MPVEPPDPTALAAVAQRYGLGLDAADLDQLSPMVAGLLASWDAVEELYNASAPAAAGAGLAPPGGRRQPVQRLVRHLRGDRERQRAAGREDGGGQGQHRGGRGAADERLEDDGGLRPAPRRHHRVPDAGRRRDDHRQVGLRGPLLLRRLAHLAHRPGAQPVGRDPLDRRLVLGQRGAGRGRDRRRGHRRRPGRLDPDAGLLLRDRRAQADLGPGPLHRRVPDRAVHRPRRADDPHRGRRRAGAERDRRPGRAGPAPAPRPGARRLRRPRWTGAPRGCASGWSPRASATPTPIPG